jgi:hypothetical protein
MNNERRGNWQLASVGRWGLDNGQYGETGNAKISPSGQVCNWRYLNLNFNKKVGID